jgi:uncharacterized protein YyaL (SSP411 family)
MEHESFENPRIAAVMNEHFICIKVDREERPDLDAIYMDAVVAMTGQGGWPMSVFLTPDGAPFYGGTYYPPTPRHGLPAFEQVLVSIARAYQQQREQVEQNGQSLLARMQGIFPLNGPPGPVDERVTGQSLAELGRNFDAVNGGSRGAPKFPQPMTYDFLLRHFHRTGRPEARSMVELTLTQMAHGGIYDHLGGGFHRYSVDAVWLTPHFEKMLYDNALLARLYLHAYQLTGQPLYRQIVEETLDYVAREMTDPGGGFYSAQDADSEGEEGKFFLWSPAEVVAVLGQVEGDIFCAAYDVQPGGNFEGKSILNLPRPLAEIAGQFGLSAAALADILQRGRASLFAAREQRAKPGRDEKILTAWNGLMLAAFAEAARVLDRADYLRVAINNAEFVQSTMLKDGRLRRTWKAGSGEAKLSGYLEDYAFYAEGLLALYQTTFEPRWFQGAVQVMEVVLAHFADNRAGGFFDTAADHEALITRPKGLQDNAIPCGNSAAVRVLLQLAAYTGQARYADPALRALAALQEPMGQYPAAFTYWLGGLEFALAAPKEVAVIGDIRQEDTRQLLRVLWRPYRPDMVVAVAQAGQTEGHPAVVFNRPQREGRATAYVCRHFACKQPVTEALALETLLNEA